MAKSKKSTKPTAVTQEELAKIQELNGNINRILVALGQAEVQKARMLSDYDVQSQELQTFGKELEENYGPVNINVNDGTITAVESEDAK